MTRHRLQERGCLSQGRRRPRIGGPATAVGIDLSVDARRASGVGVTDGRGVWTGLLYTDEELLALVEAVRPGVIAVDAPLWLPPGRRDIHDRRGEHLRPCDRELLRRRIRFFPITLGAMRKLTERGLRLRSLLEARGWPVIEVFPGGAQDVLGLPRKHHDLEGLRVGLRRLGLRGIRASATHDELDATTAAYVGWLFLQGQAEVLGDWTHGAIVLPRPASEAKAVRQ